MASARSVQRIVLNVALDGALAGLAVPTARWLATPWTDWLHPLWTLPAGSVCLLLAGIPFGLSLQYWRFAGIGDLIAVAASSLVGAGLFGVALHLGGLHLPSLTFPLVHALTLLALLGAPRVAYRFGQGYRQPRLAPGTRGAGEEDSLPGALLVGGAEAADLFIRALGQDRRPVLRVQGLIALSSRQPGRRIHGLPILGTLAEIGDVLDRLRAENRLPATLVVTDPDLGGAALAGLLEQSDRHGIQVRRAPRPTALHPAARRGSSEHPAIELKPVAIEDLLNRPQVPLDREGMARLVQGRRVLVTGAGGTIGSELARQVAALGPEQLVLLDNGEFALWQIDLELAESHAQVVRRACIADVRDMTRVRAVFAAVRPELVFHAAALKHVPMVEANPLEGLLTNAEGTRVVADAACAVGARAMVLISTDKAVNPSSVMGASKRLAEMYCQALDMAARASQGVPADASGAHPGAGMRCITVRFGNVLGSTGSVVPLFQRQLERGGPLTVTHPDMRRYFMTVREAVGLVLQATVVGIDDAAGSVLEAGPGLRSGGGVFVLDMGEPVKIVDLARQMIRLAGLRPEQDVDIRFTGLRPGEKLFEELFHGAEPAAPTGYPGLLMATPRTADPAIVGRAIEEIAAACRAGQMRLALGKLARIVPEFGRVHDESLAAAPLARAQPAP